MKHASLVTIAAFNYNNAKFVIETLESIRKQTYQNVELIIVDDCSTDDSLELIKTWIINYEKPYQLYIHEQNKGLKFGINEAINNANGKYFSLIATDDLMIYDKIESQVEFIESLAGDVGMVYGDCTIIDENSEILYESVFQKNHGINFNPPSGKIFKDVVKNFYFYCQACLINLELFKKINFIFDEKVISEDWDIELAISRNYLVYGNKIICTKYRKVATSVTSINWVGDRMYNVINSHFYMLKKYYNNSLNTAEDNVAILNRMKDFYWDMFSLKNATYKNRVCTYFQIVERSKAGKDLLILFSIILGLNKIIQLKSKKFVNEVS